MSSEVVDTKLKTSLPELRLEKIDTKNLSIRLNETTHVIKLILGDLVEDEDPRPRTDLQTIDNTI
jgi:hypothetical protein